MNNRASSLSLKCIRLLSLNSLPYCFGVDTDLSLSKANMRDILFTPFYMMGFFSVIS
ncbi:hypothetical protein H8356DRAFT_1337795 [Neocallimastix lanati (nom. inval.)]|nr:hypothetical protein H8356DRAFT_1337795 [Neocallimastix sp. JGI-2020a]